jgi:hypothetical protein
VGGTVSRRIGIEKEEERKKRIELAVVCDEDKGSGVEIRPKTGLLIYPSTKAHADLKKKLFTKKSPWPC